MKLYKYKGKFITGQTAKGVVVASTVEEAKKILEARGIFVKKVKEAKLNIYRFLPILNSDWHFLVSSLAKLLKRLSPIEAIQILIEEQANPKMALFLIEVRKELEKGSPLSEALERAGAPREISEIVKVGEKTGRLPEVLENLADIYAEVNQAVKELVAAVVPQLLITFIGLIAIFFVLPPALKEFSRAVSGTINGFQMPLITKLAIKFLDAAPVAGLAVLFGSPVAYLAGRELARRNLHFKKAVDRIVVGLPVVGSLAISYHLYRAFLTFYTLYSSGFPVGEILRGLVDSTGNYYLKKAWQVVFDAVVKESRALHRAFALHPYIPPPVKNFITIGTKSGELAERLRDSIEYLRDKFYTLLGFVKQVVGPLVFLVLFTIVSFLLLAVFLPVVSLIENSQKLIH